MFIVSSSTAAAPAVSGSRTEIHDDLSKILELYITNAYLYPFVSPVAVYIVCCIGDKIVVNAELRRHVSTYMIVVSGYKLLVRDTC